MSTGSIQLLVGPASAWCWEQMNVRSSTRATSSGSEAHQNEFGLASQPHEGALVHQKCGEASPFVVAAVAPHHRVGCGERGDLLDPVDDRGVRGGGDQAGQGGIVTGFSLPWSIGAARFGCGCGGCVPVRVIGVGW